MLVSEKKLSSADGVLLWPAGQGVCYQSAGAFQRLGGRLLGVSKAGEMSGVPATLPLKIIEWSAGLTTDELFGETPSFKTLIWAPHPALSWNEAPDPAETQSVLSTVRDMAAREPEFHPVFVVSQRTPRSLLLELQASSPRATILLTPMAFGFRDAALFDRSLELLKKNPALLEKVSKDARFSQPLHALSFSDLAAHLVIAPQNETLMGKNIWVHGSEWTLLEWLQEFSKAFPRQTGVLDRLGARLSFEDVFTSSFLDRLFSVKDREAAPSAEAALAFVVHSDADVFPSPRPQLKRSLQQHSKAFDRYPELELVFTPGRSL